MDEHRIQGSPRKLWVQVNHSMQNKTYGSIGSGEAQHQDSPGGSIQSGEPQYVGYTLGICMIK